jgi:hypothetical protein
MRARLAALALAVLTLVAAGCAGAEGRRGQELLQQAEAAEKNVSSATFELELNATHEGQRVGLSLRGGGYSKGKRAGDMFLEATTSGALGAHDFAFVADRGRLSMKTNGTWQTMPGSASLRSSLGTMGSRDLGSAAFLELARYVKEVRVTEGQSVNGEPTATISGTIDTAGLVQGVAKLEGLSELAGGAAPDLSELSNYLGDTRVAIAFSERTHLIRGAVVNLTVDAQGQKSDLQLVYRLRDVNKPVRFPRGS